MLYVGHCNPTYKIFDNLKLLEGRIGVLIGLENRDVGVSRCKGSTPLPSSKLYCEVVLGTGWVVAPTEGFDSPPHPMGLKL